MEIILSHTSTKGPVVKDSIPLKDNKNQQEISTEVNFINNEVDSEDIMDVCTTNFGGSSN